MGTTGACHHARLIFIVFLVETGFCHVGQADLQLLTSSDLPDSASQSAGITGVSHRAWPLLFIAKTSRNGGQRNMAEPHMAMAMNQSQPDYGKPYRTKWLRRFDSSIVEKRRDGNWRGIG
uniref:Secreted protein n=1 Tax=Macaca mulatta TaxID=9544 RepID=A0A5F7Z826_MACMU